MMHLTDTQLKEEFSKFCAQYELFSRFETKEELLATTDYNNQHGLMICTFPCGCRLLSAFSSISTLNDKYSSRACPVHKKAYYFTRTNKDEWKAYGVFCDKTKTRQGHLMQFLKPKELPGRDVIVNQVMMHAAQYSNLGYAIATKYPDHKDVHQGIYLFVDEEGRAYIGSSDVLKFRWGNDFVAPNYNFDPEKMEAWIFPTFKLTGDRLKEIEYEFIRKFRLADGLGYNVLGTTSTKTNPEKYII